MNEDMDRDWEETFTKYAHDLPGERTPSALLEERTVRALRKRGLLRHKRSFPTAWLAGSIAASLALFATGVVVGQYLATRSAVDAVAQITQHNGAVTTQQVQQAGTAYVAALQALVNSAQQNQAGQNKQARDVALTALHQAADQIVRLAPNDPVATHIVQALDQEQKQNQAPAGKSRQRQIVWF